jgi:hypothetical protein
MFSISLKAADPICDQIKKRAIILAVEWWEGYWRPQQRASE